MNNILHPESITDILPTLRRVALDAQERARVLTEYVDLISGIDPAELDEQIGSEFSGPSYVRDLLERVDAVCHIHTGSSEASHVRQVQSGLFSLLGKLQRKAGQA